MQAERIQGWEQRLVLICGNAKGTLSGFTCFFSYFGIITDRQYHLTPLLGVEGWYFLIFCNLQVLVQNSRFSGDVWIKSNPRKLPLMYCQDLGIYSFLQERRWVRGNIKVYNGMSYGEKISQRRSEKDKYLCPFTWL